MKAMALLATLAMLGVMMVPPAAAVHGSSYTAIGVAYVSTGVHTPPLTWLGPVSVPADTEAYKAVVLWTGYNPPFDDNGVRMPRNHYQVTISDFQTGDVLVQDLFRGAEEWGCCVQGAWEFFQYHGCHGTKISWNAPLVCQTGPDFNMWGLQIIHITSQQQWMLYSGWYEEYALQLVVESHVEDLLG